MSYTQSADVLRQRRAELFQPASQRAHARPMACRSTHRIPAPCDSVKRKAAVLHRTREIQTSYQPRPMRRLTAPSSSKMPCRRQTETANDISSAPRKRCAGSAPRPATQRSSLPALYSPLWLPVRRCFGAWAREVRRIVIVGPDIFGAGAAYPTYLDPGPLRGISPMRTERQKNAGW
jgi:hypothetical protein